MAPKVIDIRLLLDRLSHLSFDLSTVRKYSFFIHLFIIFLLAKSLSDIVVSYFDHRIEPASVKIPRYARDDIRPKLPKVEAVSLTEFNAITRRNIFNPNAKEEDLVIDLAREGKGLLDEAGALPTSLPLELVGTIILSDPKRSIAAIKKDNLVESYQADDWLGQEAKIFKVEAEKVYFQNIQTGVLEFISLKEDKALTPAAFGPVAEVGTGIRQTSEDSFVIDRGALETSIANPSEILTQARAVPNVVDGKIKGFSIFSIRPGSVYEKLGIRNGDIILRVNGVDLDSPAKALEFYGTIASASEITLDMERAGSKKTVKYSVR